MYFTDMYAEVSFGKLLQQQDDIELYQLLCQVEGKRINFSSMNLRLAYLPSLDSRDWFCVVQ